MGKYVPLEKLTEITEIEMPDLFIYYLKSNKSIRYDIDEASAPTMSTPET